MTDPQIVFIHGHAGSKNTFHFIAPHFKHAVTFDLPGFGEEAKPNVTYDKDFFLKFLEKKITKPSVLVGYSMGAVLAKEFALKHTHLVKKLILISYPMQKDKEALWRAYRKSWLYRQYVDKTHMSYWLCTLHEAYRLPVLAATWLSKPKHYLPRRDWFKHTYHSALSSLHDTVLVDAWQTLLPLKDKTVLIWGEYDELVDSAIASQFKHHIIPGMSHWIFDYDSQLAGIIKKEIEGVQ